MFNRKRKQISKLNRTIDELKKELAFEHERASKMEKENATLYEKIDDIKTSIKSTLNDCKVGTYCEACEFGKAYNVSRGWGFNVVYVCNKAETCPNFIVNKYVEERKRDDKT